MIAHTQMTLAENIAGTIRRMQADGTIGASVANLQQCTSTRGLTCSVGEYRAAFARVAALVAYRLGFRLV